jgi:hypothetical protein
VVEPIEAKIIDLPIRGIVVEPIEAPTISDLPIVMEPIEAPTIRLRPVGVSHSARGESWYPKYLINMDQNTYYYSQNVT